MEVVRLIATEMEDEQLPVLVQKHLLWPHGILSVDDLKACPKNEVVSRITGTNAAAYAMGMVLMIKRFLFVPPDDCERHPCRLSVLYPHPCRLRCKCGNDAVCRRRAFRGGPFASRDRGD